MEIANNSQTTIAPSQIKPGAVCYLKTKSGVEFSVRVIGIRPQGAGKGNIYHGLSLSNIPKIVMAKGHLVVFELKNVWRVD